MIEEWRDIEGYEGLYQVSNMGKVKSLARVVIRSDGKPNPVNEKILKILHNQRLLCSCVMQRWKKENV